jgi:two-component system sensor histidine kinase HydH
MGARVLRFGFFGLAALLGGLLLLAQLSSFRGAREISRHLVRAQGDSFVREMRRMGKPTKETLDELFEEAREEGLRYVAVARKGRGMMVEYGESVFDGEPPPRPGKVERRGGVVRVAYKLRRRPQAPHVVLEFTPTWSTELLKRERRDLAFSGLVSLALLIAAGVFWRLGRRADRAEEDAREREHLATLGEMSAVLAHEIKNPLASLKGHAQLLVEQLEDDTRPKAKAELVVDEAKRVQGLVDDLLAFAKSAELARAAVDPREVVRAAVTRAGADRVRVEDGGAPASWSLDAGRLEQALFNLVDNALEWSEGEVEVRASKDKRGLVLEVRDHGPGLPDGEEQRVFDPFFTKRTRGGVGLGLAVARRVVELHGGTLAAETHPGGGALFTLTIPEGS